MELTSSARLLERVEESLAAMPDLDSSRIEAVRSALERGDYSIDATRWHTGTPYRQRFRAPISRHFQPCAINPSSSDCRP